VTASAPLLSRLRTSLPPLPRSWQPRADHTPAAVLVPLADGDRGDVVVVFIKRRPDLRHHAGQYAFPGGRREGSEDPAACALREFTEELGLSGQGVELLGGLPVHGSSLGYFVHPVVGFVRSLAGLRPDPGEVDLVVPVPLSHLVDEAHWRREPAAPAAHPPAFTFGAHVVWGLTAKIARDLVAHLR
jgi:8-oxo-dGTP pyrophosphatase MutT (NUDIX family)